MVTEEQEYIDAIWTDWPAGREASLELLAMAEEAVAAYPQSSKLWCMRGDLIQLGETESRYQLSDSLESCRRAIAVDPTFAEAYESVGYYFDVIEEDFPLSEDAFRQAVKLGAGKDSFIGLARVVAEQGRYEEALQLLTTENCPFSGDLEVEKIRRQIEARMWAPSPEKLKR
ncbi:hypothetical protein EON80_28565 [bacterium]|nr:MAG: hypothetical protein EON80_28565 [bacterium]